MADSKRIKKVINWLIFLDIAENVSDLAKKMGYTKSSISQILNSKVKISEKFIDNLVSFDKNVNKVWIMTGEGKMLIHNNYDLFQNEYGGKEDIIRLKERVYFLEEIVSKKDEKIDELNQLLGELKYIPKSKFG